MITEVGFLPHWPQWTSTRHHEGWMVHWWVLVHWNPPHVYHNFWGAPTIHNLLFRDMIDTHNLCRKTCIASCTNHTPSIVGHFSAWSNKVYLSSYGASTKTSVLLHTEQDHIIHKTNVTGGFSFVHWVTSMSHGECKMVCILLHMLGHHKTNPWATIFFGTRSAWLSVNCLFLEKKYIH
jgi:hypothetical protein